MDAQNRETVAATATVHLIRALLVLATRSFLCSSFGTVKTQGFCEDWDTCCDALPRNCCHIVSNWLDRPPSKMPWELRSRSEAIAEVQKNQKTNRTTSKAHCIQRPVSIQDPHSSSFSVRNRTCSAYNLELGMINWYDHIWSFKEISDWWWFIYILCMSEKYRIVITWFHIGMLCPMVYVQISTPYMNILVIITISSSFIFYRNIDILWYSMCHIIR